MLQSPSGNNPFDIRHHRLELPEVVSNYLNHLAEHDSDGNLNGGLKNQITELTNKLLNAESKAYVEVILETLIGARQEPLLHLLAANVAEPSNRVRIMKSLLAIGAAADVEQPFHILPVAVRNLSFTNNNRIITNIECSALYRLKGQGAEKLAAIFLENGAKEHPHVPVVAYHAASGNLDLAAYFLNMGFSDRGLQDSSQKKLLHSVKTLAREQSHENALHTLDLTPLEGLKDSRNKAKAETESKSPVKTSVDEQYEALRKLLTDKNKGRDVIESHLSLSLHHLKNDKDLASKVLKCDEKFAASLLVLCLKEKINPAIIGDLIDLGASLKNFRAKEGGKVVEYTLPASAIAFDHLKALPVILLKAPELAKELVDGKTLIQIFAEDEPRDSTEHILYCSLLVSKGILVGVANEGTNDLGEALSKCNLALSTLLSFHGADFSGLSAEEIFNLLTRMSETYMSRGELATYNMRNPVGAENFSELLKNFFKAVPKNLKPQVLELVSADNPQSDEMRGLLLRNRSFLRVIAEEGFDLNTPVLIDGIKAPLIFHATTDETRMFLIENGADPKALNSKGQNLFHIFAINVENDETLSLYEKYNLDLNKPDNDSLTPLGHLLRNKAPFQRVEEFFLRGANLLNKSEVLYPISKDREVSQSELIKLTLESLGSWRGSAYWDAIYQDFCELYRLTRSPYQLFLFTEALEHTTNVHTERRGIPFYQLTSHLLRYPQTERPLKSVVAKIADVQPYESELMLLLNETTGGAPDTQYVINLLSMLGFHLGGLASSALSRQDQIILYRELPRLLPRIGSISHSFSKYRFDAMQIKEKKQDGETIVAPSLFEAFGAVRIKEEPDNYGLLKMSARLGAQYLFKAGTWKFEYSVYDPQGERKVLQFSPDTAVIARQGAIFITNPDFGTVLIRNSSPEFGRNILRHAAYYSKESFGSKSERSIETLLHFDFSLLEEFIPIQEAKPSDFTDINALVDEYVGLMDQYRKFKFDTDIGSAWNAMADIGIVGLNGAHLSEGFAVTVQHIRYAYETALAKGEALALGSFHRDYPAFEPYTFIGPDGNRQRYLQITEEAMTALEKLSKFNATDEELNKTGIRNFYQEACLDKQGELVILTR